MQNKTFTWFVFIVLLTGLFCLQTRPVLSAWGDYTIVCGIDSSGREKSCNIGENQCIVCEEKAINDNNIFGWVASKIYQKVTNVYYCTPAGNKIPGNCQSSIKGGGKGESSTTFLTVFEVDSEKGHECIPQNFLSMYTSSCVSCDIVSTMSSAFVKAAAKAYDVSKQAGVAILIVGTIIWIGLFILKNISSFSTVEPRQMIQGLLVQLFKIYLAYIIVTSGILTILHYTFEPIIIAGTDIATTILASNKKMIP